MSKYQQWLIAWICLILSLLVMINGGQDSAGIMAVDHRVVQAVNAIGQVPQPIEKYIRPKRAAQEAGDEEYRSIQEYKRLVRADQNDQGPDARMQYLLASRSIHMEKYAELEKKRIGRQVANIALRYVGTPYVWGGTTPRGFDCSGFTQYVLSQSGIIVPRNSYDQYHVGKPVQQAELQPGDLLFFTTYAAGPSHLGIYIGEGKFVHALNQNTGVITSALDSDYYKNRYLGAKRVL
ncbi:MAG: C40 family peptidase [Tumebacillaceae bacterium]